MRTLLESDRFFLDVLYVHAVEGGGGGKGERRGRGPVLPPRPPPRVKEEGKGKGEGEVEVVDLEDTESEGEGGEVGAGAAAGAAGAGAGKEKEDEAASAPSSSSAAAVPAPVPLRAQVIWEALTEYGERHPWRPQGDYFFDVAHGPLGVARLLLRAQLLLAHPVQRDPQVGAFVCSCLCGWKSWRATGKWVLAFGFGSCVDGAHGLIDSLIG